MKDRRGIRGHFAVMRREDLELGSIVISSSSLRHPPHGANHKSQYDHSASRCEGLLCHGSGVLCELHVRVRINGYPPMIPPMERAVASKHSTAPRKLGCERARTGSKQKKKGERHAPPSPRVFLWQHKLTAIWFNLCQKHKLTQPSSGCASPRGRVVAT